MLCFINKDTPCLFTDGENEGRERKALKQKNQTQSHRRSETDGCSHLSDEEARIRGAMRALLSVPRLTQESQR